MMRTLRAMFAKTSPWPLKVAAVGAVLLGEYVVVPVATPNGHRHVLLVLCGYVLSTVLPSVVFAMPHREQTTAYVVQTVLMLLHVCAFLAFLRLHGQAQYEGVSVQLVAAHMLWAQSTRLHTKVHILLYQGAIVVLNRLLLLAVLGLAVFLRPPKGVDHLALLVLTFMPEALGLSVRVLALAVRALGGSFEDFMLT
jgi:hypothetical protein